jgi:predicted HicB family RNase H-like nuclease
MLKKKLNSNPADTFITQMDSFAEDDTEARVEKGESKPRHTHSGGRPAGGKDGKEQKRKRLNLIIAPSLHGDIQKIAVAKGISFNETVSQALFEYRDKEKRSLEKYEEIQRLRKA